LLKRAAAVENRQQKQPTDNRNSQTKRRGKMQARLTGVTPGNPYIHKDLWPTSEGQKEVIVLNAWKKNGGPKRVQVKPVGKQNGRAHLISADYLCPSSLSPECQRLLERAPKI
jgi:hypothetical protein